ncbi:MAG: T9SS type A sorting domain-containing protein [bacterium]
MLKILLCMVGAILLLMNTASAQTDVRITGLSGIDDSEGVTHLIYPTEYRSLGLQTDSILFNYYIFNTQTDKEELLFHDYTIESTTALPPADVYGESVADYKFWGNDPRRFICAYNGIFGDAYSYISRYDMPYICLGTMPVKKLHVSSMDTNIVYACFDNLIMKSTNGGKAWPTEDNIHNVNLDFHYIQHSPFDDNIIFGYKNLSLYKSIDGGKTAYRLNFWMYINERTHFIFDKDQQHIYAVEERGINVSDNCGEPGSWKTIIDSNWENLYMVYDSLSGDIFFSLGKKLYKSTDHLSTYDLVHEFPEKIYGIYKKPGEEKIYVAFNSWIEEFNFQQSEVILRKSINKSLELFPLSVGNEWNYFVDGGSYDWSDSFTYGYKNKILSDTTTSDGLHYFKYLHNPSTFFANYNTCWLRVDSLNGKIYASFYPGENEVVFFNLLAHGDMYYEPEYFYDMYGLISAEVSDTLLWNKRREVKQYRYSSLGMYQRILCQGIGMISQYDGYDFGHAIHYFRGCVINNVVYGDTVLVKVKDSIHNLPDEFSLMQNYPNPFNPATVISYQLPVVSKVNLRIYDILGREVAILVNEEKPAGTYEVKFNGSQLSSGVYIYQLRAGTFVSSKKFILTK